MKNLGQILKEKNSLPEESKSKSVRQKKLMDWNHKNEAIVKKQFMSIGKEMFGSGFEISKDRAEIVTDLLKYFTGNENETFNLDKGVYLYGPYGIGKSVLLSVVRKTIAKCFWRSPNGFMLTSLEEIIDRYKADGDLDHYTYRKDDLPMHLCVNEFGKQINDKIYGTDANQIIHSLFMIRYDLFQNNKMLTHATSNYSPNELDVEPVIGDRLVEMFNFVELSGNSKRK